ncbi:EAL domain-containing protein [Zoogloea sp.]|uniref:putative bifunctional diguanylate cyclase/phosphodiesterase n=1 Tax=Zoogloea sp. TaxID=49181 RepID=UPI00261A624A|nr:EAL domain-containing protein [Zoogloea sp.]MDD3354450.1 EAL domain-containing protein [Zoogloea sp.]
MPRSALLRRRSLAIRITLAMVGLLLLVQLASQEVVRATVTHQARSWTTSELQVGERVWQRLLDQNALRLKEATAVLSSDFGFRSAIASGDRPTIESALDNSKERIGAGVAILLDPAFRVIGSNAASESVDREVYRKLGDAISRLNRGQIALINDHAYQFVMTPVRAPTVIGWVLMGFPISQELANDLHRLSGVHVTVQTSRSDFRVSTLPPAWLRELQNAAPNATEIPVAENDTLLTRRVRLEAQGGQIEVVFLHSIADATAPFRQLRWLLGLITVGGVLLFALGSLIVARRITRPLNDLMQVTEALEQGQFQVVVPATGRQDELGQLARGFEQMRDGLARQRREILQLAYWDRLTGLPNREQFRNTLKATIEGTDDRPHPVVVITLNVDRFKHVNNALGYAFGDALLKAVAQRLQQQVYRKGDLVARLGGDEFAILLTRADAGGGLILTERISQSFEAPLALGEQTVDLSASMGIACWPQDGDDADTVMSRSQMAMHVAKTRTAGVMPYSPAIDSSSSQNLSLLSDLRHALQGDELRLYLQPKITAATGQVVAAEALLRWQHPRRGLVPPMEFVPFAEQTGFIRQLTLWIFEAAARHWQMLQSGDQALRIAINLSTRDLLDLEFPERLVVLMERHGVGPSGFCLEVTESATMDDPARAEETLNRLAQLGFKLSIDDFGTGYSSLAYLKRLPVHELKIDRSFVMSMTRVESDAQIVRSTVDLAHNLGLTVVAEGVEDETILRKLAELGCDEAQGYYISKPLPISEFPSWRESWSTRQNTRS